MADGSGGPFGGRLDPFWLPHPISALGGLADGSGAMVNDGTGGFSYQPTMPPSPHAHPVGEIDLESITLGDWLRWSQSAARAWGGVITANGDGTVAITAGAGIVHEQASAIGDCPCGSDTHPGISALRPVVWGAVASLALTDNAYNFIYFDGADDTIKATTSFSSIDFTRAFTIGRAYRSGTTVIARLGGTNLWNFDRRVQLFGEEVIPVRRASGMMVSASGTRNIAVSAAVIWAELVNRFTTAAFDSSGADRFTYWYRNGSGGWTEQATQSQINNTQYDNGTGTLATLTPSQYGVHWVYVVHDGSVHVVFGQDSYLATAAANASPPTSLPGLLAAYATLAARIVIQRSAAAFTSITSAFDTVLAPASVAQHNDLGGLQGGTAGEYYHLTSAERSRIPAGAVREQLTADRTYYVRTDGSDANNGLADTAAGAFLTIQKAIDVVATIDTSDKVCKIIVRAGTYGPISLKDAAGSGNLFLEGDTTTPANVVITRSDAGATVRAIDLSRIWSLSGVKITNTAGSGASDGLLVQRSSILISAVEFGAVFRNQVRLTTGALLQVNGTVRLTGNAATFLSCSTVSGILFAAMPTITLVGTPAYSNAVISLDQLAAAYLVGTWSGAATGKRYDVVKNASADVGGGGASYIPGSIAGTTATGGQYN